MFYFAVDLKDGDILGQWNGQWLLLVYHWNG